MSRLIFVYASNNLDRQTRKERLKIISLSPDVWLHLVLIAYLFERRSSPAL